MNKPLLLSLATAMLLTTNLSAESMYERFEAMEKEMQKLKAEIAELKSQKSTPKVAAKKVAKGTEEEEDEDEEDAKEPKVASASKAQGAVSVAANAKDEEEEDEEDSVEDRLGDIEEAISEINRNTSGSHLKFQVDYRFAIENMDYEMADGSSAKNDAFMTNRLWIDMGYKATNNLSFIGQLAYNKAFGARSSDPDNPQDWAFEGFDWIANENAFDDKIRVRSAYFLWQEQEFMGLDIPWTFSIGRRPSTNGALVNLRDDDAASSPIGHGINVEFDGLSSQFTLSQKYGTSVKLCLGRGMSEAAPKFASTPYADSEGVNSDIDLAGFIFTPYDDKQYKVSSMYYYASNLIDVKDDGDPLTPLNYMDGFNTVGGMHSGVIYASAKGIGKNLGAFLDDTTVFASFAVSKTDPRNDQRMLDYTSELGESKTGTSFWIGTQFPSLITDDGKWGLEYNHGSKYWRSVTYGEDTNIGSKVAARGDAYEAYFTEYLVDDILSMQLRYTYIDYKYSGSNGFFGTTSGNAMEITNTMPYADKIVDKAQDIRLYIRYRY
ncbi:DUF3373 family protein [Sulfurimonas sp.]|uniref:DUF3373 family protein n=1 Tax=Sulfurimonas sp. TaxID=2022749 RepID=UPI003D0FF87C